MSDVAAIADGLTKAQRKAVLRAEDRAARGVWHPAGVYVTADRRVRYRLALLDIAVDYLRHSNRLTPLGLQVREHLKAKP